MQIVAVAKTRNLSRNEPAIYNSKIVAKSILGCVTILQISFIRRCKERDIERGEEEEETVNKMDKKNEEGRGKKVSRNTIPTLINVDRVRIQLVVYRVHLRAVSQSN